MTISEKKENFEFWLMDMDAAIDSFISRISLEDKSKLDFSIDSLCTIENWILQNYSSSDEVKNMSNSQMVDGAARYIGETFRKILGGKWFIDYSDKDNVFFGLPQLKDMKNQKAQICPLTLVSASASRRKGNFLINILRSHLK
ncbi:MAG: hypothetical protein VX447_08830 [Pseudomonadota bacterium]|uniref:DUF3806 domain-containing protein n=1 Tax=Gallaecimonas pentaromativorans TaxID=584787 RepID=A0A3N1PJR9_9GAMM|nr:hypothetical protein [Gallaecimonas pentaromativorans]MED5524842.1 hypothetical protein [Pseudomonadota bacterium]ROQ28853.1 hypothetical protein EDC28_103450 [Gallaecimonas pentaromativorans]